MSANRAGISPAFLLLCASAFWGVATVLSKSLLSTIAPVPLLFVQLLASSVFLVLICVLLKKRLRWGWSLLPAALLGVMNPGISYTFSMMALERIPASVASIFWATEPFLILVLAALVLKEKITVTVSLVIAVGFAGAALVTGVFSDETSSFSDLTGCGFMLVAVILCAIYTVLSRKLSSDFDPLVLVAVQQVAGLSWATLLMGLMSVGGGQANLFGVDSREILYAAMTGIMYYALAYWLYLTALGKVSAALAGASFNVIPLVAIGTAFVFLGERLGLLQVGGVVLILISGFMLVWLTNRPVRAVASAT